MREFPIQVERAREAREQEGDNGVLTSIRGIYRTMRFR